MSAIQNRLTEIKNNGYNLNFGDAFSEAFEIWKNIFFYGALAFFIIGVYSAIINGVVGMLPFMQSADADLESAMQNYNGDMEGLVTTLKQYYNNPEVVGVNIFSLLLQSLMFPLIAGIVYMAYRFEKDGTADISYLFEGFNGNRFGNLILLFFLYRISSILGLMVFGVGFFVPFVGFTIASCFVLFNDMKVFDAIKASFGVMYKKFFLVLVIMLCSWIFGIIGIFGCIIGVLFTMPLVPIMCYVLYKNSVGVEITSDIDAIGDIENS